MKKLLSLLAAAAVTAAVSFGAAAAGCIFEPTANEDNSIVLKKGDNALAALSFRADDDPETFFFHVETNLNLCLAAEAFDGQDAYYRSFVINPSIPATSVPTVALYNPYLDEDGEPSIDPEKIMIYQVRDDKLTDVTSRFTVSEDSSGDSCFVTSTRFPGTYVLAEKSVDSEWLKPQNQKHVKKLPVNG